MNENMKEIKKLARDFAEGDQLLIRGCWWTIHKLTKYGEYDHSWIVHVRRPWEGRVIKDSFVIDKLEEWTVKVKILPPYQVGTFRDAGLKAKWTKRRSGRPVIAVYHDKHDSWYIIDKNLWEFMCNAPEGLKVGFKMGTLISDIFSIPA